VIPTPNGSVFDTVLDVTAYKELRVVGYPGTSPPYQFRILATESDNTALEASVGADGTIVGVNKGVSIRVEGPAQLIKLQTEAPLSSGTARLVVYGRPN
jgi:hypothetical protein